MNKEIKDNWVAALVGGKYEQCRNRLHVGNGFCCLGVLTDLYLKAHEDERGWEVMSCPLNNDVEVMSFGSTGDYALLPDAVQEWAGLNTDSPKVGEHHLSGLNDDGKDFTAIAQMIEESDL